MSKTDTTLPPLPPATFGWPLHDVTGWNEFEMRAYARAALAAQPAVGWVTMWPAMGGGQKPVYSHGPAKPSYGPELDALLTTYPVFGAPEA